MRAGVEQRERVYFEVYSLRIPLPNSLPYYDSGAFAQFWQASCDLRNSSKVPESLQQRDLASPQSSWANIPCIPMHSHTKFSIPHYFLHRRHSVIAANALKRAVLRQFERV